MMVTLAPALATQMIIFQYNWKIQNAKQKQKKQILGINKVLKK